MKLQVVIPMSGFGERFRSVGYKVPKPLINVDGKPIIAHIIDSYPIDCDFIFICNSVHLSDESYDMRKLILLYCPEAKIVEIEPHKLGPVNAILFAEKIIDRSRPVVVNYCDFGWLWNYTLFEKYCIESGCDGVVVCYTGFHPHMLKSVNFAYVKEEKFRVVDIQEKKPFTDIPMDEFASSGTYYFKSGGLMIDYMKLQLDLGISLNGEYYVSLTYKRMIQDKLLVFVFPIRYFMQWGTPEDLSDYNYYSHMFSRLASYSNESFHKGLVVVPMAGLGSRFTEAGYSVPKPLIDVLGNPMVLNAIFDLPKADSYLFILRKGMKDIDKLSFLLCSNFKNCRIKVLDAITNGQAVTCYKGLEVEDYNLPITIGACDNGIIFENKLFDNLMNDNSIDIIVWVIKGYPLAKCRPEMFSWVSDINGRVDSISVKSEPTDVNKSPLVIGTFTFKRGIYFKLAFEKMMRRNGCINGEYYVDECINDAIKLGYKVHTFEIFSYLNWGTPNELRTFNYWSECFDLCVRHPYKKNAQGKSRGYC